MGQRERSLCGTVGADHRPRLVGCQSMGLGDRMQASQAMTELTLFASTFVLVFALGAQSLNVNNGHYIAAALTSFVIGIGQMVLFKLAPEAGWSEIAAFLAGGPFGITASMWAHPRLARILKRKKP